jgi:regulator of replication initiation timing
MKTTKDERTALSKALTYLGIWCGPDYDEISGELLKRAVEDADEAERLEAENAKLRKRLEAFDDCIKKLYEDATR